MLPLLLLALVQPALGCCRGDPSRTLVAVNASLHTVAARTGGWHGGVFDRDDFESVWNDRVEIWATQGHIEALHSAGLRTAPTIDTAQLTFEAEKAAAYMDIPGEEPDWTQYCGYECMTERLSGLAAEGGCQFDFELINIGQSVQGRSIWAFKIGNNAGPEVLMGGNIHGDEPVGNMVMQRWAWTTCNAPTPNMVEVATSVQGWYLPNMNPDGYEMNRRNNANNADLNRNFPKPSGTPQTPQPETIAYMDFVSSHAFSITTHFHGGAVVCNTAYDNCYTEEIVPRPCPPALPTFHPRAEDVVPSSRAYCDPMMAAGVSCNVGTECQVNGAAWYQISGSEQDWVFHFMEGVAMTMEMTNTKRPGGGTLPGHYENNEAAFHSFMMYPARKRMNATTVAH
jgi:hypothetical protein